MRKWLPEARLLHDTDTECALRSEPYRKEYRNEALLESALAPFLGTLILICTIVLIGLSVPTALREAVASRQETYLPANVERVRAQFELAGLQAGKSLLADDLRAGRRVLSTRCVGCHDLRTVLARAAKRIGLAMDRAAHGGTLSVLRSDRRPGADSGYRVPCPSDRSGGS
jgi:hypothetical protein